MRRAALERAFQDAAAGLGDTPCLIWLADFIAGATGHDPAAAWRGWQWTEAIQRLELARLGHGWPGETPLGRVLARMAYIHGWRPSLAPVGASEAILIGCYAIPQGNFRAGFPAIFDGRGKWLTTALGAATITNVPPAQIWEIPGA